MNKALQITAFFMAAAVAVIIIYTRIIGVDLTEGQMLEKFYPQYVLCIGLLFGSIAIINNTE